MKKLLLALISVIFLFSSCVVIDSRYTGKSRMRLRVYNDYHRASYYGSPIPVYYGYMWLYVPYGYWNYSYWYGNYAKNYYRTYKRDNSGTKKRITKRQLKSGSTTKTKTRTKKSSATKTKSSGKRVKK